MKRFEWPLVWRSRHRALQVENFTIRTALKQANEELHRYKMLCAHLSDELKTARMFEETERIIATARQNS